MINIKWLIKGQKRNIRRDDYVTVHKNGQLYLPAYAVERANLQSTKFIEIGISDDCTTLAIRASDIGMTLSERNYGAKVIAIRSIKQKYNIAPGDYIFSINSGMMFIDLTSRRVLE